MTNINFPTICALISFAPSIGLTEPERFICHGDIDCIEGDCSEHLDNFDFLHTDKGFYLLSSEKPLLFTFDPDMSPLQMGSEGNGVILSFTSISGSRIVAIQSFDERTLSRLELQPDANGTDQVTRKNTQRASSISTTVLECS